MAMLLFAECASRPDSDRFRRPRQAAIMDAIRALSRSHRLEFLDHEGFGKAGAGPFLKGRQRHHRLHIGLHLRRRPRSHRCESDAPPAQTWRPRRQRRRTGTAPTFRSARGIRSRFPECARRWRAHPPTARSAPTGRCRFMPHSLRSATKPECISAEIERAWARRGAVLRPQPRFRKPFGQIFDDGQRIPDRDVAIDQRRHLARMRETQNPLLVGIAGIERDEDLPRRRCCWPAAPATAASTTTNSSCCRSRASKPCE